MNSDTHMAHKIFLIQSCSLWSHFISIIQNKRWSTYQQTIKPGYPSRWVTWTDMQISSLGCLLTFLSSTYVYCFYVQQQTSQTRQTRYTRCSRALPCCSSAAGQSATGRHWPHREQRDGPRSSTLLEEGEKVMGKRERGTTGKTREMKRGCG